MSERFTFFWRGPFSQWHRDGGRPQFEIGGVKYNCAEQWMMASKARFFKDAAAEKEIMKATHPRDQKDLGRTVKNFVESEWNKVAKDFVYQGNMAKFSQNPKLKEALLATAGTTLVEASPVDKIWGIGLAEDDPLAQKRETWQGTNWLGEVLTRVREDLSGKAKAEG